MDIAATIATSSDESDTDADDTDTTDINDCWKQITNGKPVPVPPNADTDTDADAAQVLPPRSFDWGYRAGYPSSRFSRRDKVWNNWSNHYTRQYNCNGFGRRYYVCNWRTGTRMGNPMCIGLPSHQRKMVRRSVRCHIVYVSPKVTVFKDKDPRDARDPKDKDADDARDDDTDHRGEERNIDSERVIMATGILFYSLNENKEVVFLLGKEQQFVNWKDSNRWADAGGRVEESDPDVVYAAAREAYEETMGFVSSLETIQMRLRSYQNAFTVDTQLAPTKGCYRMYALYIPYEDYNTMMQRAREFLQWLKIQITVAEKTCLQWVTAGSLITFAQDCVMGKNTQLPLRPNFAKSINEISKIIDLRHLPVPQTGQ